MPQLCDEIQNFELNGNPRMVNLQESAELASFRLEIRSFVARHLPERVRDQARRGVPMSRSDQDLWELELVGRGWFVPHWPVQWGGLGMNPDFKMVLDEELARNDCPEANVFGTDMVGPMLMRFGDEAQKHYFLPRTAGLQIRWCQGYSEPNAGSDLAALQTRAVRASDHYVVNGSKIWTSGAHYADWMFALVRTGAESKPQEGISFLLIDMKSPGITVQPVIGIHGWHMFNQVFFDNVWVPVVNRVAEENAGWTVAKSVLESERLKLSRVPENHRRLARVKHMAAQVYERGEPVARREWFKLRLAALEVRLMALEASVAQFRRQAQGGARLGPETGRLKLRGSQLIQDFENLAVDVAGPDSLAYDRAAHFEGAPQAGGAGLLTPWFSATASARRFISRGFTIAGGSSEIQHNQLAKQVLGL